MKKLLLFLGIYTLLNPARSGAQSFEDKARAYILQYASWAVEEQQRVGIPAAIKLAQGIYETGAGESELATKANNHFGIKCKKNWTGETFLHTDDAPNECFRKYASARQSYIDHSDYLKTSARYAELFTYDVEDYSAWAKGLKRCGYATNPAYASRLIKMIEDFGLQQYTLAARNKRPAEIVPVAQESRPDAGSIADVADKAQQQVMGNGDGTTQYNQLRAFYARKGESPLEKAKQYNIRYARLLEINELNDEPFPWDGYYYLEPKHQKAIRTTHEVKEGETVALIAHLEGISRHHLRNLNYLSAGEQPLAGEVLQLQATAAFRPRTYMATPEEKNGTKAVRLVQDNSGNRSAEEYIPTKKNTAIQVAPANNTTASAPATQAQTEEFEIGYGAAPPPELQQAKSANMPQQSTQTPVPASVEKETAVAPQQSGSANNTAEEAQPKDEFELLKEKLDKVVYARSSKSNMKVSSSDSSALYPTGTNSVLPRTNSVSTEAAPKSNAQSAVPANAVFHVVQKGETGYSIAKKYNITVKQLNELNGLDFGAIKVGQKLRVR